MRTAVRQALILAWKDTRVFVADRFAVGFAFLFPLVFVVALTLAFGDIEGDEQQPAATLTTAEAPGGISHQLIAQLGQRTGTAGALSTVAALLLLGRWWPRNRPMLIKYT